MSLHKDLAKIAEYIEGNLSSIGMKLNISAESIEHAVDQLRNEALRKSGDYRESNPLLNGGTKNIIEAIDSDPNISGVILNVKSGGGIPITRVDCPEDWIKGATFYKDSSLVELKDGQLINHGGPDNVIIFEKE